ncbi:MAG: PQQ-binding-like beta-propeller repeat protein [Planctomycetes bacterium]|nr:PQQ-binding-like beta-propeller repeat protein [Planctomycetota bacterium]
MKKARIGMLLVALVSTRLIADESLKYWPQWRGPTWNGVASQADPPVTWSETENLRWKTPIEGSGCGTPIVWGDRIFLLTAIPLDKELPIPDVIPAGTPNTGLDTDAIGKWKPQRFAIVCIDRITGKLRWSRTVHEAMPHQGHHRKAGFASASAVTDGQRVYAYFGSFGLYCCDFEGQLVWQRDPEPQAMENGLGEGSSPALFGDRLVIVVDQEQQSYVMALDKRTGKEIWRQDRDEVSNWSTPRILTHAGRRQVVLNGATVRSYDFATGELLWQCGGQSLGAIPMAAVGHGLVFAASGWRRDTLHAIKLGQRGDLTDSKSVVWSLSRGTPYVPCPMVWGEEIYLLEDRSFFSCLRATDGLRHYFKHRLPGSLPFSASPVGAADRIYLLSEKGKTVVLQRGPKLKVLAINELDETFYASPAIVGDAIYLRGDKHLFCFAKSSR